MMSAKTRSSFSVNDIQGDTGETFELEIVIGAEEHNVGEKSKIQFISEGKDQNTRKIVDNAVERKKIKSINDLNDISKAVHHKDIRDSLKVYSRKLEEGNPAKGNQQLHPVLSDRQQNRVYSSHGGFDRLNVSHKQQFGSERRSNTLKNPWARMSSGSPYRNTRSSGIRSEAKPPSLPTSTSRRLLNRSSASSAGLFGDPHGSSVKQRRTDERELCSKCKRPVFKLSKGGPGAFLCSTCRRKSKPVEISSFLNTDLQTPAAKLAVFSPARRNSNREGDVIGRTPGTAMEIDSSEDEAEATNDTKTAMDPCEQLYQSEPPSTSNRMESSKIPYPSKTDPDAVEILASDVQRLNPLEFLNDTIIDYYIKYIQRELLSPEDGRRFHFFNSFFYKKLNGVIDKKKKKKVVDYSKLRKWTRGINIFEKDYLFIPVHDKLHWSLAIVCFPNHGPGSASGCEQCILHLDSMTCGHDSVKVFRLLRSYLLAEKAEMEGDHANNTIARDVIPARKVPVPLQENDSDCGLFLLHYIRKFVESAPKIMKMSDVNRFEESGLFGRQWFLPIEASSLRTSIQEQLQRLFAKKDDPLGMSSDASLETFEVGMPRKLEAEF